MASLADLTASYPHPPALTAQHVRAERARTPGPDVDPKPRVLIVLDDDPTGTQSVADLPVLTSWSTDDLIWAMEQGRSAIYVVTNTRSLSPDSTIELVRQLVTAALEAAEVVGLRPVFVSRSDSTLRGHFPREVNTIADILTAQGGSAPSIILVPAFPEAGRVTVDGVHYVRVDGDYLPAARSQFAQDATFGYTASHLSSWVEEKTEGAVPSSQVATADLSLVRGQDEGGGIEALEALIMGLEPGAILAPDIACEEDMRVVAIAASRAELAGKHLIYQAGPPFVRTLIGQEPRSPLTGRDVDALRSCGRDDRPQMPGGLVVVGSHVSLTTAQLASLTAATSAPVLEIEVPRVLEADSAAYVESLAQRAIELVSQGLVIVQTSRTLVRGSDPQDSLRLARCVSDALSDLVARVVAQVRPRFVVAKGGITSSDVATRGLSIRRAYCVGPMLEGMVSLWLSQDGPARQIPYVVFPGNVGDADSLRDVVATLSDTA